MISLQNDYSEGAHPQILKRLAEINLEQNPGYCTDSYCASAAEKIRQACACPEADIFFLVGGTQTNQVVIDTMLAPYEGKPAPSNSPATKCWNCPSMRERYGQRICRNWSAVSGRTAIMSTWCFPVWSISPTLLNTVRCTVKKN